MGLPSASPASAVPGLRGGNKGGPPHHLLETTSLPAGVPLHQTPAHTKVRREKGGELSRWPPVTERIRESVCWSEGLLRGHLLGQEARCTCS